MWTRTTTRTRIQRCRSASSLSSRLKNIFFFLFLGGQTFAKNIYQCIFYGFYAHICLPYNLFPFSIMQNRKNPQEFHFGILFRFRSNRKSFSHFTFAALNLAFIMLPATAALIVFSIVINQAKLVSLFTFRKLFPEF